jgi:hypothetical protein
MSEIDITEGNGLCSMMKCGRLATLHIQVHHSRDGAVSFLWACPTHSAQIEQFARNIMNGPGLEFFVQMAPRTFRLVVIDQKQL